MFLQRIYDSMTNELILHQIFKISAKDIFNDEENKYNSEDNKLNILRKNDLNDLKLVKDEVSTDKKESNKNLIRNGNNDDNNGCNSVNDKLNYNTSTPRKILVERNNELSKEDQEKQKIPEKNDNKNN